MTRIVTILCVLAFALVAAMPVQATPILFDQWYGFHFMGPGEPATGCPPADPLAPPCAGPALNSLPAGTPRWTITLSEPAFFEITDAYRTGDSFRVYDGPTLILTTPGVPVDPGPYCTDPEACRLDPAFSHGIVALGAGLHEFSIVAVDSPWGAGTGYFRVTDIPEPGTLLLLGGGLLGLGVVRRFRR